MEVTHYIPPATREDVLDVIEKTVRSMDFVEAVDLEPTDLFAHTLVIKLEDGTDPQHIFTMGCFIGTLLGMD